MSKNLPIGFDTSALNPEFKQHSARGIGRYVRELDNYFQKTGAYSNNTIQTFTIDDFFPSNFLLNLIEKIPCGKQTIKQQVVFPAAVSMKGQKSFSYMHFPAHMDAPSWSSAKTIVTVLDLIPLIFKDLYAAENPSWRFHLARFLEIRAIKNASHLIAISESTKNDVNRILGVPLEKISVTYLGVDETFFNPVPSENIDKIRNTYHISSNELSILYVGGIDPRKNITKLIKAFEVLSLKNQQEQKTLPKLILAGKIKQDKSYLKLKNVIEQSLYKENIIETGYLEDIQLKALYRSVSVFCFPSLYEGFGLPVLEAFACGVPVVCGNNSCMPEVVGHDGAAVMVDVENVEEIVLGIIHADINRVELIQKGFERAKIFTWYKTGESTIGVYEKVKLQV